MLFFFFFLAELILLVLDTESVGGCEGVGGGVSRPVAQFFLTRSDTHLPQLPFTQLPSAPGKLLTPLAGSIDVCLLIFTLQTNWLTKRRSTSPLPMSWTRLSANCLATKHCPAPLFCHLSSYAQLACYLLFFLISLHNSVYKNSFYFHFMLQITSN